jgi:hypothetical protein
MPSISFRFDLMPWFRHPITYRIFQPDPSGPFRMRLQAIIQLELERAPGWWIVVPGARLDTGASLSIFSAAWARQNRFTLPAATHQLPTTTAAGHHPARVYDLDLNARFRRMPEHPFSLAVVFSDAHPPNVPPLVGLHNLLNYWRYAFDGSDEPAAIMGHMRFETL